MPRILLLTTPEQDYLQDQVLYGLRMLLGADLVDLPRKDVMYRSSARPSASLYGRGFTLWKLLEDIEVERPAPSDLTRFAGFDAVVFGSIRRQKEWFWRLLRASGGALRGRLAFLDGADKPRLFLPATLLGRYYKRERGRLGGALARSISFSIPACKLVPDPGAGGGISRRRRFASHVQCDVAYELPEIRAACARDYLFGSEDDYRRDLQESLFGITMKKAGWDCMRHYEIAANGAVPCFFELRRKPRPSAPSGLVDMHNCVAFDTARELEDKTARLVREGAYAAVQASAWQWARDRTCENVARQLLEELVGSSL